MVTKICALHIWTIDYPINQRKVINFFAEMFSNYCQRVTRQFYLKFYTYSTTFECRTAEVQVH